MRGEKGEKGEKGEIARAVRGEKGERSRDLALSPLPTPPVHPDGLDEVRAFARLVRDRFGAGVTLHRDRYGYLWEDCQ